MKINSVWKCIPNFRFTYVLKCVCVCVYMCIHTHTHTHTNTLHTYVRKYIHTYTCVCVCATCRFSKNQGTALEGWHEASSYWGLTNVRYHHEKFSCPGNLVLYKYIIKHPHFSDHYRIMKDWSSYVVHKNSYMKLTCNQVLQFQWYVQEFKSSAVLYLPKL
jgi:hypothetical protein